MKGIKFGLAFLFETPFAVGRSGFFAILFMVIVACYGYFGLKVLYWYQKECKIPPFTDKHH